MARRIKKKDVDQQLLNSLFTIEEERKNIESIMAKSIDPTDINRFLLGLSKAKYMFLLKEAKHRKISAIKYRV